MTDWLARALVRVGALSPSEVESAIRGGRVRLGGRIIRQPLALVRPGDRVLLDGVPVDLEARTLALAFHKPAGVVTSRVDQHGRQTVFDLLLPTLPEEMRAHGWHAIGRLDRDTTGLLLFTNDERLVEHATSPRTKLPKRYVATVQGTPDDARLEPLRRGLPLDDGPTLPAQARLRGPHEVELTLTEGRYHQVKRMLGAIGLPVRRLHREAVGGVVLDLPASASRLLTEEEIRSGLGYVPRR